ncbi:MAG: UDP-N-acetylmuramate dehydrogenase, partial [Myxococcota bacterium]|nr:UDP-N-acetylmuramate dehydrogenase [Myxococcota bacterium]
FSDQSYSGAVLHLGDEFGVVQLRRDDETAGSHILEAGAALSITRLMRIAKDEHISGVEFLGGVPGTIGGAIRMNAGTVMGEVSDTLVAASCMSPGQPERWIPAAELGLSYRRSSLPFGAVVTGARFRCMDADPSMRERLDKVLSYRKQTQPLQAASCGSVFANPPGDHAGRLIEACGLKGRQIGGAQISEVHANWIINQGDARASDVHDLINLCISEVERQHGVTLRHEVQLLGDWAGGGS